MSEPKQDTAVVSQISKIDRQFSMKNFSSPGKAIRFFDYLDLLLKKPGNLFFEMNNNPTLAHFLTLSLFSAAVLLIYGIVVGSFSGGNQLWIAPLKIIIGLYLSALICLPSLYIFACLGRARIGFISVIGNLLIALTLMGILLIGFAPVAWVFSQSTTSIPFIGFIHVVIYLITLLIAFRLLWEAIQTVSEQKNSFIVFWMAIFILVSLQMTTSLRPIIGTSDHFLPAGKKFFLSHWVDPTHE
jgi:hypothetical protein